MISETDLNYVLAEQNRLLGEILVQENLISQWQLEQTLIEQNRTHKKLGELLVERQLISGEQLEKFLEKQYWQKNGFWLIS
ncbi:MAG: hypothetical protein KME01_00820 [Chroococcus sp. CMT-3BRIN-NPC107]|nr:hypothetical protein [Chroococcus sp. CMT-3BRIN-NPC107]